MMAENIFLFSILAASNTLLRMWILGSAGLDALFFIAPALVSILFAFGGWVEAGWVNLLAGVIIFSWIDSGHVYITVLRTYTHLEELASSKAYVIAPFIIFGGASLWLLTGGAYIWMFVVYATLFHNVRQFYGLTRWYQKKAKQKGLWPGRFIYLLCLTPVVLYHFRKDVPTGIYSQQDIFLFSSESLLKGGLVLYGLFVAAWLIYEAILITKLKNRFGITLSILIPALSYGLGFLVGQNVVQVLGPIIVAHGIGYWAVTSLSVHRTRGRRFKSIMMVFLVACAVALCFGTLESQLEDIFLWGYLEQLNSGVHRIFISLGLAALLTPLFLHFYFDSKIWSKRHREAHLVFGE